MPNDMNLSDLMRAAQAADQQVTALSEIHLALSKLRSNTAIVDVLIGLAVTCADLSELEDDDFEIMAQRIDECVESLEDELDGGPSDAEEVIRLDNKARAEDMNHA